MKLDKTNWYGFDHTAVRAKLEGDLTYCNTFCVLDEYHPVAVYKAATPDRAKGHKDYVLLNPQWIRGMDAAHIEPYRYQDGMHCHKCDTVVYSIMRHDFHHCECEKVAIDGGRDYTKRSYETGAKFSNVSIDLLTDEIRVVE